MNDEAWIAAAVPVVIGLVQLAKSVGFPAKWAGILAAALGIGGGLAFWLFAGQDWARLAYIGLLAGLAAAGLWSTGKNALENREVPK